MKTITDRQYEIIKKAGKLLATSGVSGLTIKNLAKEMGFSESAIYRHFPGKEEIIIALLKYLAETMDEIYANAISQEQTIEDKFTSMFKSQFRFFSENPYFVVAVFSDGLMEKSDNINNAILKIMQVKMKYLMPIIMEGQQKGVFTNKVTAEELIHFIMGAFRLQMYKWKIANFQFDIQRNGNNMLESILTLIRVK